MEASEWCFLLILMSGRLSSPVYDSPSVEIKLLVMLGNKNVCCDAYSDSQMRTFVEKKEYIYMYIYIYGTGDQGSNPGQGAWQ